MRVKPIFFIAMLLACALNSIAQRSCPTWGPYVNTTGFEKKQGVLMMADVMMPANGLAAYTYACAIQFNIGESGGYCGIQKAALNDKRPPNNIFSIWDFPNKVQIIPSYKDPLTYVDGFGGEGTGLHSHADFNWKPGQWYTNVVRCWNNEDSNTTSVGYFIYDQSAGTWKHYVTFIVPEAKATLHGNIGSFLENFSDGEKKTRAGAYKAYWLLQVNGIWIHPEQLVAEAGPGAWKARPFAKDGAELTSCGTDTTGPSKYTIAVTMGKRPAIDTSPAVYDIATYYDKGKKMIYIDWSMQPTSTPQLSYRVAVYASPDCTGLPLLTATAINPAVTMVSLPVSGINLKMQDYYVTLQIKDIFEQESALSKKTLHDFKP